MKLVGVDINKLEPNSLNIALASILVSIGNSSILIKEIKLTKSKNGYRLDALYTEI